MGRVSPGVRGRPVVADAALALAVLALDLLSAARTDDPRAAVLVGAGLALPLAARRARPVLVALVVLAAAVAQLVVQPGVTLRPADVALAVALYTLVGRSGRRVAAGYLVLLGTGIAVWSVVRVQDALAPLLPALVLALAWALAEFVGARRAYAAEVAARLAAAEADRDRSSEDAVAAERRRIARELHDVVAHAVTVMVVQADGAGLVLERDPATARQAMGTISATGRQALAELRRTVLALRGPEPDVDAVPTWGSTGLSELAERLRAVGLPVELELRGDLDGLPAGIGIGVHRIVAEALTNVLRHAGPGASARVLVHRRAEDVAVAVRDTGGSGREYRAGAGAGLVGMRERVAVLDGTLRVGPWESRGDTAGWEVVAELPL